MDAFRWRSLSLILAGTLCAVLAVMLVRAQARNRALIEETSRLSVVLEKENADANAASSLSTPSVEGAAIPDSSARSDELAARRALLAQARRIPEVARWEASLRAIRRLKAQREVSPPPPKPLPPPLSPNGSTFPELMNDPEYRELAVQVTRNMFSLFESERLSKLGVSADVERQIVLLRVDDYFAMLDENQFSDANSAAKSAANRVRNAVAAENEQKMRALLGEEVWARYQSPSVGESAFRELSVRLSYTDTPLTTQDEQRLQSALATTTIPRTGGWFSFVANDEFMQQARAFLQPAQIEGLIQLYNEHAAYGLRGKLPKDSQLPRTIRREKRTPP